MGASSLIRRLSTQSHKTHVGYGHRMRDGTARRLSRLHSGIYRLTGGMIGRRLVDNDMLLLTTTGRVTGHPHTVPLLYLRGGDASVVFASWGGRDHHPEWYLNLVDEPHATVQIDGRRHEVRARTAAADERSKWWTAAQEAYTGYTTYQSRTDRLIPVVILEPA